MRLDSVASGAKSGSTIQYGLLGACEHPADSPYALLITIEDHSDSDSDVMPVHWQAADS